MSVALVPMQLRRALLLPPKLTQLLTGQYAVGEEGAPMHMVLE